jgi:release factor glutamine methyltransferase
VHALNSHNTTDPFANSTLGASPGPARTNGALWPQIVWTLTPGTPIGRAINAAARRLEDGGIDPARLDAQVLLAHLLGKDRSWLFGHHEEPLSAGHAEAYTALIERRMAHEPVAYLIGHREFYGIELLVDPRVLIPRPETEMLVDAALEFLEERAPAAQRVIDVGTGSGAIALAVALNAPEARITAVDLSPDALAVAAANVARLDGQITLCSSDLLAAVTGDADLIVANLPYIDSRSYTELDPTVRDFEPKLALEAGPQGLDAIACLLAQAPAHLAEDGLVLLEIGYNQSEWVAQLIEQTLPAFPYQIHHDYQGHPRMVTITR